MNQLFTAILLISSIFGFSQTYESEMNAASTLIQNKDFCKAYDVFDKNLNQKSSSYFDYYYGAISAIHCNNESKAINWLQEAKNKGLGLKNGETDYLQKDLNFTKIHDSEAWKSLIESMKTALLQKEKEDNAEKTKWLNQITQNANSSNKYQKVNSGFALYFSEVKGQKVPYLVYVPKSYSEKKSSKAIVFLHGGVVSLSDYYYENPEVTKEPIFDYAEKNNTIVIYPFAKKDFGWVDQLDAFKNVITITETVEKKYNINKNSLILGGMSNGGTATFWFATQKKMPYTSYFSISAMPKLKIGNLNFQNISKPLYSINTKDDDVFKYEEVKSIYDQNKSKNWHFETIETGGHGLIYNENGGKILAELLSRLK